MNILATCFFGPLMPLVVFQGGWSIHVIVLRGLWFRELRAPYFLLCKLCESPCNTGTIWHLCISSQPRVRLWETQKTLVKPPISAPGEPRLVFFLPPPDNNEVFPRFTSEQHQTRSGYPDSIPRRSLRLLYCNSKPSDRCFLGWSISNRWPSDQDTPIPDSQGT